MNVIKNREAYSEIAPAKIDVPDNEVIDFMTLIQPVLALLAPETDKSEEHTGMYL